MSHRIDAPLHLARVLVALALGVTTVAAAGQSTGSIVVTATHPPLSGEVGCALFASAEGFPNEANKSRGVRLPASGTTTTCTFDDIAPGTYAVAAFLDTNGNQLSDRNFVGMPTEPWGVSNGVRPRLRAPRFAEAAFTVTAGQRMTLDIALAK